jgi:peptide/nickel transport system substrate-binding protein
MKRGLLSILVLAMVLAVVAGCGGTTNDTTATTATTVTGDTTVTTVTGDTTATTTAEIAKSVLPNPQGMPAAGEVPQYGGTMKAIVGMTLSNIGAPWSHMPGPNLFFGRAVCEMLTGQDADGKPAPQLATSWVLDPEKKTYAFTLREGVKFQDDTPFNAEAVKWNLQKSIDAGVGYMTNIASIDVIDDYHVTLNLKQWDALLLEEMSDAPGMMVSPTAAQALGDGIMTHPVGTGPFEFVSFTPDVSIELKAFDGYWQEGLPYLDGIEIQMVTDPTVRFAAFLNGECDWLEGIGASQVKEAETKGFTSTMMVSALMGLTWDSKSPTSPFSDIRVRQAVAQAAPYQTIVEQVFEGMYPYTNQFAGNVEGVGEMAGFDPTIVGYTYDEAKAAALLAEAGYGPGKKPIDVTLTYTAEPAKTDEYTAIQSYLAKVNINLTLKPVDYPTWGAFQVNPDPGQMSEYVATYQKAFPYSVTLAEALSPGQKVFTLQATTPAYDALYATMLAENDPAKKADLYKQLNKMAVDTDCLAVPQHLRLQYKGIGKNLHDMGCGQFSGEYDPSIIWLSK